MEVAAAPYGSQTYGTMTLAFAEMIGMLPPEGFCSSADLLRSAKLARGGKPHTCWESALKLCTFSGFPAFFQPADGRRPIQEHLGDFHYTPDCRFLRKVDHGEIASPDLVLHGVGLLLLPLRSPFPCGRIDTASFYPGQQLKGKTRRLWRPAHGVGRA